MRPSRRALEACIVIAVAAVAMSFSRPPAPPSSPQARTATSPAPAEANVDPDDIIRKSAAIYAACSSYQDSGKVIGRNEEMRFQTFFKRPHFLRFDWDYLEEDGWQHNCVCYDGKVTHMFFLDTHETPTSVGLGIAGATGVSSGASHTVPRMLMPTAISGLVLTELKYSSPVHLETVERVRCYLIEGQHPGGYGPAKVWIGVEDHLIRRVEDLGHIAIYESVAVDRPVPADAFSFPRDSSEHS